MKTLSEIYDVVVSSDELKEKFAALKSPEELVSFVESLGGKATLEEIAAFLKDKQTKTGELSDEDMDQVAGGKGWDALETVASAFSLGIMCAIEVTVSLVTGNVGTAIEGDHALCELA